ncbi:MAG: metalloregulator ArsR/SmtB family transcription factor [Pseudomonadota bacterium]
MPSDESLNQIFAALSHPARRAIIARLATGAATVNELAEPFQMSLPAVSRHIKVLERSGLIRQGQDAQFRPCELDAEPLRQVASWTEVYRPIWEARFVQMEAQLKALQGESDD